MRNCSNVDWGTFLPFSDHVVYGWPLLSYDHIQWDIGSIFTKECNLLAYSIWTVKKSFNFMCFNNISRIFGFYEWIVDTNISRTQVHCLQKLLPRSLCMNIQFFEVQESVPAHLSINFELEYIYYIRGGK